MKPTVDSGYSHTQHGTVCLFLYGLAVALLIGAWATQTQQTVFLAFAVGGSAVALIAPAFHHLTVEDCGDALAVYFGPLSLPMFSTSIPYHDIVSVEVGRTLPIEGVGIHRSPRGGWVWNIKGRDCVVVQRRNGVIRIGTDDADNLARFLAAKIGQQAL